MTKEKEVSVLVIEDGIAYETTITNDLESKQAIVGGLIEEIQIDGVSCIINEEGRIFDLERSFAYEVAPNYWDCVHGNAFFVGVDYKEGEYKSLTDEELHKAYNILRIGKHVLNVIKDREWERENAN